MVRIVPLAERAGKPFVEPSAETVMNGVYPLSRPLYLYVNEEPGTKFDPLLREFLRFANSLQGQQAVVSAKAYPLTPAMVARNLTLLDGETVTASTSTLSPTN
jgi:phosphate transport system substrate-binding protein